MLASRSDDEAKGQARNPDRDSAMEIPALDLFATLRRAAEALTPVVIDPGPEFPRVSTFVDAVTGIDPQSVLLLHPVSADAIPARPGRNVIVRSCDPDELWMVTGFRLDAIGDHTARVDLRGAVIAPLPRRALGRTRSRGREPLVLSVQSGTEDLDGCVFPIHGLSATHAIIEATVPLALGQTFDPVEVIGNRRILRRASATILEVIPWIEHDGSRRFRCRMALDPSVASPDEQGYDLLSHGKRILRLIELSCMLTTSGWYQAPGWPRGRMRFQTLERDKVILALDQPPPDAIPLPMHVQMGCELFSACYEMQVRPLRRRGAVLEVSLPLIMRRHRRRREQRAAVASGEEVWVTFRNPVTDSKERRRVTDISFGGLCFDTDPEVDVLWPGIILEEATVSSPCDSIPGSELDVRSLERRRDGVVVCHTANRHANRVDDTDLVNLLGTLRHPDVESHDGSDFRGVLGLYRKAGLIAEFINRNLEPVAGRAALAWSRLHDSGAGLAKTFIYRQDGGVQAAVSAVRAWERTWLAQHFASDSTGAGQATGALHLAYLDYVLPRSDAHYLAFFVKADNTTMNAFYSRFSALAGTPEAVDKVPLDYWIHGNGAPRPPLSASRFVTRRLAAGDEVCVARAAERSLGRMVAGALSLQERQMTMDDTDRRFSAVGLRRYREGQVVTQDGRVVAAVLGEHTSPGVNLTWMLNAWWLIPVHADLDDGQATALALDHVLASPAPVPGGDRFLITAPEQPTEALQAAGFEKLGTVYLYVFNRSGLHRYYQYISDRYGEVEALVTRRRLERGARLSA
jgi:hypothetical protein